MEKKYIYNFVMFFLAFIGGICLLWGCSSNNASDESLEGGVVSGDVSLHADSFQDGGNNIVVGFSQVGSESDWRNASTESFLDVFTADNGYYLLYEDAQQKQENQLKAIRNFILQEVDYIILDPIVETGWDAVLLEAKEAGIPVILVDRKVVVEDDDLYTCWVGSDFYEEGKRAGEWLWNYLQIHEREEEKINIVTLQGTLNSSSQIGRTEGFNSVLNEHVNWYMLDRCSGEFTQAKGQEVMEKFLNSYDDIDVVISENDNMTFGAIKAIEAAGKTCGPYGDIIIISFDAVKAALQLMMDWKIHADFECNPLLGTKVSDIIQQLENGDEVKKTHYVEEKYFDTSMDLETLMSTRVY